MNTQVPKLQRQSGNRGQVARPATIQLERRDRLRPIIARTRSSQGLDLAKTKATATPHLFSELDEPNESSRGVGSPDHDGGRKSWEERELRAVSSCVANVGCCQCRAAAAAIQTLSWCLQLCVREGERDAMAAFGVRACVLLPDSLWPLGACLPKAVYCIVVALVVFLERLLPSVKVHFRVILSRLFERIISWIVVLSHSIRDLV